MGVTVKDLLNLPSLSEARVVAGQNGLGRLVSSVSVLEYCNPGHLMESLYKSKDWAGGELVISGLINVKDDVEAQCRNVRYMAQAGEVGLVLYYVGIFVPTVSEALKQECDRLGFPLIVMPENRFSLRYSDVISEVYECLFKDRRENGNFVSDILERVSSLPEYQRSIDTVLKMLSDQIHVSAVLTDRSGRVLNAVAWPRTQDFEPELLIGNALSQSTKEETWECTVHDRQMKVTRMLIDECRPPMLLYLFKEGEPLPENVARQCCEIVRLAANLWSKDHAQVVISELVRAILKDEPIKMRRLADIFHIDVASIHTMWVARFVDGNREEFLRSAPNIARELLRLRCNTVVADVYDEDLIAFIDWPALAGDGADVVEAMVEQFDERGIRCDIVLCHDLTDTAAVRSAYLTLRECLEDTKQIWPQKQWYTLQEIWFAQDCRKIVDQGEQALQKGLSVFAPLETEREYAEIKRTLTVYLLDTNQNVTSTAEQLFLHKNTVKYRLQRIGARLGYRVDKWPEAFRLYQACALERLIST